MSTQTIDGHGNVLIGDVAAGASVSVFTGSLEDDNKPKPFLAKKLDREPQTLKTDAFFEALRSRTVNKPVVVLLHGLKGAYVDGFLDRVSAEILPDNLTGANNIRQVIIDRGLSRIVAESIGDEFMALKTDALNFASNPHDKGALVDAFLATDKSIAVAMNCMIPSGRVDNYRGYLQEWLSFWSGWDLTGAPTDRYLLVFICIEHNAKRSVLQRLGFGSQPEAQVTELAKALGLALDQDPTIDAIWLDTLSQMTTESDVNYWHKNHVKKFPDYALRLRENALTVLQQNQPCTMEAMVTQLDKSINQLT